MHSFDKKFVYKHKDITLYRITLMKSSSYQHKRKQIQSVLKHMPP